MGGFPSVWDRKSPKGSPPSRHEVGFILAAGEGSNGMLSRKQFLVVEGIQQA